MNHDPRNDCPPDGHEWTPSPFEAGTLCCAWPGCQARMEAPAVVEDAVRVEVTAVDARRAA